MCMSIPNQVIVYRFYNPQNKFGMQGICERYWKGKYNSTFRRRVRDEVKGFQVASGGKGRCKGQVEEPSLVLQHAQMLFDFPGPHDEAYKEEVGN